MIQEAFYQSVSTYNQDTLLTRQMWEEIERNYTATGRHYHNLDHLDGLLAELEHFRKTFTNWDTIVFAIVYHDVVYNTLKSNNEEKSAEFAAKRLYTISFPGDQVSACLKMINATRGHEAVSREVDLFTDADLSILGSSPRIYQNYTQQIRREYSIYPDIVYRAGRRKVLMHFLMMENIFKTPEFSTKYEVRARSNMQDELEMIENA